MKNVSDLKVTQIRIFPIDVVPLHYLYGPSAIERIKTAFQFKEVGKTSSSVRAAQGPPAAIVFPIESLAFNQGEVKLGSKVHPIESLVIESRRILSTFVGSSHEANKFYAVLESIIAEFDNDKSFEGSVPLVLSEESGCNLTLDIDIRELLSPEFANFIQLKLLPGVSSKSWIASPRAIRIGIDLSYSLTDEKLLGHTISPTPKAIFIHSAAGSPIEEKRFLAFSPTDTQTHLSLLGELEHLFRSSKGKKSSKHK